MSDHVLLQREGPVLVVTINRPAVRNAIDRSTSQAIADAMDLLDADAALMIGILTGAGGHFCAGMDLKAFLQGERVELEGRGLAGIAASERTAVLHCNGIADVLGGAVESGRIIRDRAGLRSSLRQA